MSVELTIIFVCVLGIINGILLGIVGLNLWIERNRTVKFENASKVMNDNTVAFSNEIKNIKDVVNKMQDKLNAHELRLVQPSAKKRTSK